LRFAGAAEADCPMSKCLTQTEIQLACHSARSRRGGVRVVVKFKLVYLGIFQLNIVSRLNTHAGHWVRGQQLCVYTSPMSFKRWRVLPRRCLGLYLSL